MSLRAMMLGLSLVLSSAVAVGQQQAAATPDSAQSAETIMRRVAANQDRAEEARSHYTYVQHAHVISRRGSTVMCEELTDSRVTPLPDGSKAELIDLRGRMLQKHKYVSYTSLADSGKAGPSAGGADHDSLSIQLGDDNTDRDLVEHLRHNLTNDNSKDGINARLFPLTSKNQGEYVFHLVGRERMNGRDVFHIDFRPKNKADFAWKGDAYIDTAAYEPVLVTTELSRKVPIAVRTLLGTNVPGLGFTVVYAPQPDGVWFPVNLGTEFKIHVFFLFSREIVIEAHNKDFEKTHVSSTIVASGEPAAPQ